jgi:hypothetical protein
MRRLQGTSESYEEEEDRALMTEPDSVEVHTELMEEKRDRNEYFLKTPQKEVRESNHELDQLGRMELKEKDSSFSENNKVEFENEGKHSSFKIQSPSKIYEFSKEKSLKKVKSWNIDNKTTDDETPEDLTKKDLLLNERIIPHVTVQGYFDDPILPYRMREVIVMKENKPLLRHYEASLPSWAVVMATYGYYRPSFRKFQYWFMIIISLISMMIGFFDLYKNLPIIKPFFINYMESIWNWLEDHVILRMTFFMGYLFSQTSITAKLAIYLMQLPFFNFLWFIWEYLIIFLNMLTLPFFMLSAVFKFIFQIFKFLIVFPQAPILSLLYSVKWLFQWLIGVVKTFKGFIKSVRQIGYAHADLQNTTTILQSLKNLAIFWGKSSIKKLFDGLKAVYNTIAHIGSEIGKYRFSILRYVYERFLQFLFFLDDLITKPGRVWISKKIEYERLAATPRAKLFFSGLAKAFAVFLAYHLAITYIEMIKHHDEDLDYFYPPEK